MHIRGVIMLQKNGKTGFTLIELMIVVAIIAILAAIAYPSYIQYTIRTSRADVQAEMMQISQRLQNYYLINHHYTGATLNGAETVKNFPSSSPTYSITLVANAQTYLLSATPKTGTVQAENGDVIIDHQGNKCWTKTTTACTPSATTNWDGK